MRWITHTDAVYSKHLKCIQTATISLKMLLSLSIYICPLVRLGETYHYYSISLDIFKDTIGTEIQKKVMDLLRGAEFQGIIVTNSK